MSALSDLDGIAERWLSSLASALANRDSEAVAATFLPQGWLRDVLTFTWNRRSLEGTEKIAGYLVSRLPEVLVSDLKLNNDIHFRPASFSAGPIQGVEFGYTFETEIAHGKGFAKVLPDGNGEWKALTASTIIVDLKGHEEMPGRESFEEVAQNMAWGDWQAERRAKIESDPQVLIIGGGQAGLQAAARFKQMNIRSLIVERNKRIGDNWRQRYRSLALHTTREHHTLLYQEHPSNWPLYTPRDKVASMLESYAIAQDLAIWLNSQPTSKPVYDLEKKQWTINIDHGGESVVLHPQHIVVATGFLGAPYMPALPERDVFEGVAIHSSQYSEPKEYFGKDVIVIGAGNTSIDICQDLATNGVKSVTMVQRSSTCVVSRTNVQKDLSRTWKPGVPVEVGDFKASSVPFGFIKKMMVSHPENSWEAESVLHAKLKKAGLAVNIGPEGEGQFLLVFERGGGYWLDKGGADLIASGDIKVKQGVEPTSFTKTGLIFSDGSEMRADAVIFATGYVNIRDTNREMFGADIIDNTDHVWGLNEEGELRGIYCPSGYPGFWYASGDFLNTRFDSKVLAIYIKAAELGLVRW